MAETERLKRGQWIVLAAAFLGWMFDGVEIGLTPQIARPALRNLLGAIDDSQVGSWNGYIFASFLLGAAFGGLIFGWLGDKIGRVRAMTISVLTFSLVTGAAGLLTTQPWQLCAFLFVSALGMGGQWAVAVALVMECWPERHRPKLAGAIGAASNFGFLMIALVAFFRPVTADSWRQLMYIGATPAVLALVIMAFVPESERWKQAARKSNSRPLHEVFSRGMRRRTLFAIAFSAVPLIGTWAAVSGWIPAWVEQLQENELSRAQVAIAHPVSEVLTAGPADEKSLFSAIEPRRQAEIKIAAARSKAEVQIFMAIGAIISCFVTPLVGGKWGRRPTYFALCLLSLLSCSWLFGRFDVVNAGFMALALWVGAVTAAFYGWLPLYLPEVFPTRVRATGQGLSYNSGRFLAAIGALNMGWLVQELGGNYASAGARIVLIYLVGMVLIWFVPETKGKPLPD